MSGHELPTLEEMFNDLAKVDGLAPMFAMIATALDASPSSAKVLTDEEREALGRAAEGRSE